MRPTEITLAIFEKYKPEELVTVAKDMAQAQTDMETAETEKKMSDSVFNERIKGHAAKVSELAQKYNKGGETAQIGCTIRYDIPEIGKKSYIRMDTEETIEVHDMTLGEKQETLQFPLTASADKPAEAEPEAAPEQAPIKEPKPAESIGITFKDIQALAAHLAQLPEETRAPEVVKWEVKVAANIMRAGKVIGPDGRIETVEEMGLAAKLANAYLNLAIDEILKPKPVEEVTRICPYPGCILFAEHEGEHNFPPNEAPAKMDAAATPEPQLQPEAEQPRRRRKTKLRGQDAILPDPRKPSDPPAPGAQPA